MKKVYAAIVASISLVTIGVLTACSSGGATNPGGAMPAFRANQHHSSRWRSGIASEYLGISFVRYRAQLGNAAGYRVSPDKKKRKAPDDLFVDNNSPDEVAIIKNKSWNDIGSITSGIVDPDGNWFDKHGLYIANYMPGNIEQYSSKGKLMFTYSSGMTNPDTLTTDSKGNIYEADFTGDVVNEYHQGSNTVVASCTFSGFVEGVAVDANGDVFAAYYTGVGNITEFKGGLSGCSGTALGATVSFPGGMVLDKNDNLILCDQIGDAVDIIDPPYSSISGTLGSGYSEPFHVSLNKNNTQAYVTDTGSNFTVDVVSYPGGSRIATLASGNGVSSPYGAVDGSNFVP